MKKLKLMGVTASVLLASTGVMAKSSPIAKHLAGPAEEIELMQKASPESTAIVSKHAMLPIQFELNNAGEMVWQKNVLVDGENPRALVFGVNQDNWQLDIKGQNSLKSGAEEINFFTRKTQFGMGQEQFPATQFELENLATGSYQFQVKTDVAEDGYLLISSDSPYRLKSFTSSHGAVVGEEVSVSAAAFSTEFAVVKGNMQFIDNSYLNITAPDGTVREVSMFDDGVASDKAALDGQFNASFRAEYPGLYQVQVVAQGITPKGQPFLRTVEHIIPVIESDLMLNSKAAYGAYSAPHKIDLSLAVGTNLNRNRFRVMAEVWGTKSAGKGSEEAAVSWLSTIAELKDGELTLQLDDRWLIAAGVAAPFSLKNIRMEDTEHYISVLEQSSLDLLLPTISQKSFSDYDGGLYESMLKGEKPADLINQEKAAGGKLMLVHGYCSGDAWGPVQSQFSNNVKFTDFNQNRSHDAFARLIDSYGDNFPSFGVVAHSQGGAASLHLYTYYWSGLDNAGSGRLIQSVGTPYQGTPLAGNLAAIGDIFGVGCGYNSNLTVSGGGAWLSGIPTWARSKVNYYTTSFTKKWWRPDWCNFASDIILSDPEDGTTEKARGQVSGAVNRGHVTGQCHTEGMRDMAQTRDGGRNSTMSANAAR
ncbi:hypothetical protein OS175_06490 [Marinicella sp. S1101]|uniref:choice-of-anchor X domain-containing protein n=1 Tax=Marinicella marina TaxID=2996016 RepID=UPI002260DF97|nr:choice-of-anchor X domain-containing protein [Marinicella marina]MCX7553521.1 hypothetical protein [Marinicella marina]MDJ1140145.1 hypothetical protein [Marinicella marina]